MAEANTCTTSELARRLGVTAKAVTSAIERGDIRAERFTTTSTGRRTIVDVDGAIDDYRDAAGKGLAKAPRAAPKADLPALPEGIDLRALDDKLLPAGIDLNTARTIREWWAALSERTDYERKAEKLVEREEIERGTFTVFRATRDAFLALPDRLADDMAAETDPRRAYTRIRTEVQRILTDLASSLRTTTGVQLA